jgi:hypothetical protein
LVIHHAGKSKSDFLGDPHRGGIVRVNVGDDLLHRAIAEPLCQDRRGRLGRIAAAPGGADQAPADLDFGPGDIAGMQHDPAEKLVGAVLRRDGPVAEARRIDGFDALPQEGQVFLRIGPGNAGVADHLRVAVHEAAGLEVVRASWPQQQACRLEAFHRRRG